MPPMTNEEREAKEPMRTSKPRTWRNKVNCIDLCWNTTYGIERANRSVSHEISSATFLPSLNIVTELVDVKALSITEALEPANGSRPEAHSLTTKDDFTSWRTHKVFCKTSRTHRRRNLSTKLLITNEEGECLSLRCFHTGRTIDFGWISSHVVPRVDSSNETHSTKSSERVAKICFAGISETTYKDWLRCGEDMPNTTEDTSETNYELTTEEVFKIVDRNDPTLTTERCFDKIRTNDIERSSYLFYHSNVTTTRCESVIERVMSTKIDYKEGSNTKSDEMCA
mmetsp:Transcript_42543/g.99808  ORF Transcript_42543/g.99808 Transcript_42543/m.99808 type:complete len:283 (+) Transcript_42543:100-948(+)